MPERGRQLYRGCAQIAFPMPCDADAARFRPQGREARRDPTETHCGRWGARARGLRRRHSLGLAGAPWGSGQRLPLVAARRRRRGAGQDHFPVTLRWPSWSSSRRCAGNLATCAALRAWKAAARRAAAWPRSCSTVRKGRLSQ